MSAQNAFDTAQICLSGHVINLSSINFPATNKDFCDRCGEKTITACPQCGTSIRGSQKGSPPNFNPKAPGYCIKCGGAYPWTEQRIQAAIDLFVEESQAQEAVAKEFEQAVKDIVRDTPRTRLAASRFMRGMKRVGKETASAIKDVLVEIVSETAKKVIWPQG